MAIRALGWNKKVLIAQFLKCSQTGEINFLSKTEDAVVMRPNMRHKGFVWNMDDKAIKETKEDIEKGFSDISANLLNGEYSLVILDEILDVIDLGFISEDRVFELFERLPETEFVLTGRKASFKLRERAHYITNMTKEKHPFDEGLQARKGIEY